MGRLKNLSIKTTAIITMFAALLLATFFSAITNSWIEREHSKIAKNYLGNDTSYYLTNEQGEQIGDGVVIGRLVSDYSQADHRKSRLLEILSIAIIPFCFFVCILAAGLIFYRWKIQRPLSILEEATAKIAKQDLDFSVHYSLDDEMGKLITSFEKMRGALSENNKLLWRTAEERRRVNAAFAHDLRTPLTVLKGYNSFILMNMNDERFTKQKLQSTSQLMEQQINRLEGFVDSMNSIQRLEQLSVNMKKSTNHSIQQAIKETTLILDDEKFVDLKIMLDDSSFQLDLDIVLQVYENLLNNALRYAKSKIIVRVEKSEHHLIIQMEDDGIGFTKQVLHYATAPFFRGSMEESKTNLGLGLYISHVLCEKHEGELKISNGETGAKITAVFKIM